MELGTSPQGADPIVPGPLNTATSAEPLGVRALGTSLSFTLTVQTVLVPNGTGAGEQRTLVEVARADTTQHAPPVSLPVPSCVGSPLYQETKVQPPHANVMTPAPEQLDHVAFTGAKEQVACPALLTVCVGRSSRPFGGVAPVAEVS